MRDIFVNNKVSENLKNSGAETLTTYEKHYMELLRKYMPEIKEINEMLENVRKERQRFYTQDLINICRILDEQKVNETEKKIWLDELKSNMERSFKTSEDIINHYVVKNIDEFEAELKKILNKV